MPQKKELRRPTVGYTSCTECNIPAVTVVCEDAQCPMLACHCCQNLYLKQWRRHGVDSTPLLPEVIPEIDANPMTFLGVSGEGVSVSGSVR